MITIVIGTNRQQAKSRLVANWIKSMLSDQGLQSQFIDLADVPADLAKSGLYENVGKNDAFNTMIEPMRQSEKFYFIVPEYNGSFPGVLKTFIDAQPYPSPFRGKKAALIGISSGMQGAGLALSHLTDIFHYLGMQVLAQKPKLAFIEKNLEGESLDNAMYQQVLEEQMVAMIEF